MNSIVVTSTKQNIKFGYEGEDNVTKIIFPYDESWLEYGEGNFEVRILRCGDEVAYTATEVVDDRQAMTLTMTVTDIELSVRGRGEMQLCYVCPDSIKKSPIYQYTVNRSVDYKYAVDPPEGSIIASVEKSLSEIKNTTNRLSNSVISIESSIDDVNSQIDNINDKISEFDEEIDSIGEVETRVDNLETSIQSINGRINTAEGNINENTESISDLNESVTELENRKVTDLETSGGRSDSGKYLTVGTDGKIKATSLTIPPTITVDASLSTTSTNPVQNKVIKTELNNINSNIETCNTEISKINGSLGTLIDVVPTDTASGVIASFNDGADDIPVKNLTIDINAVQDLHGYDKPWIAGGGKNLLDPSLLKNQSAWNVVKIYANEGTVLTASTSTPSGKGLIAYFRQPDGEQNTANAVVTAAQHKDVTQTVGSDGYVEVIQRRSDGTDSFQNYNWQIEVGSTATDYEPYENICPISGWTGCEVVQTGKNIFGGEIFADAVKAAGDKVQIDKDKKTFTFTRSKKNEDDLYFGIVKPIKVKVITVIITYINNAGNNCLRIRYSDGTTSSIDLANSNNQKTTIAVTSNLSKNVESITITYYSAGATKVYYDESGVFEGTVTIEDFVPYQGNTLDIDWTDEAGTVYGGSLDVTTGVLTKTHMFSELPISGWTLSGVNFWHNQSGMSLSNPAKIGYCSHYPCNTDISGNKVIIFGKSEFSTVSRFVIRDNSFSTVSDLEAYLSAQKEAGTPVTVAYPLATPRTYQLTPQEVKTILGENNIFADTGDVSVEYRADIKKYIDKVVATAVSALS